MLPTVSKTFGVPLISGEMLGIEVELEGRNLPRITSVLDAAGWYAKDDPSLKMGGLEFTLKKPIGIGPAQQAIIELYREIDKFKPEYTNRTAAHVHYNISDLPIDKAYDLYVINLMFEELLLSYVEEERRGNMFCLSASDADGVLATMIKDKKNGTFTTMTIFESFKYGNLNFAAAGRYGTIEYRSLQTPNKADVLLAWVQAICAINAFVRHTNEPASEFIRMASTYGPERFAQSVLGDNIKMFDGKQVKDLMIKGIRNAQHIAFTPLNTEAILKVKPRAPRPPNLDHGIALPNEPFAPRRAADGIRIQWNQAAQVQPDDEEV